MSNRSFTRREFVIETGARALAIGFLAPAIGCQAFSREKTAMPPVTFDLSNPEYKPLTQLEEQSRLLIP